MIIESTNFRDRVTDTNGDTYQIVDHTFDYPKKTKMTKAELEKAFPNVNGILSIPKKGND